MQATMNVDDEMSLIVALLDHVAIALCASASRCGCKRDAASASPTADPTDNVNPPPDLSANAVTA
jgi:hypothetical protein